MQTYKIKQNYYLLGFANLMLNIDDSLLKITNGG